MKNTRFNALLPFLLLSSLALVTQVALASTPIDETGAADADGRVKVETVSGSLSVIGWDQQRVEVTGELGDGAELRFKADGDRTLVSVRKRSGVRRMWPSHLVVHIPTGSELGASAVSASMNVESMIGEQDLETVSGAIRAELAASEIDVNSVSGRIRVTGQDQQARVEASSVSGSIRVEDLAGEVEMTSVSGRLKLNAGPLSRVNLDSTSGAVDAKLTLAPSAKLQAETISGAVRLQLASAKNLEVDIETFSGGIDSCFDEQPERKHRHGPGRTLRFKRGSGDRLVRAETLSGSVQVCASNRR